MTPAAYAGFFLATAGAAAAFIGLLFVALSIHPRLAFGRPTPDGVPRQLLTEATLVTLGNGFVLSCVGLLPTIYVGWFALGLGPWGVLWAGRLPGLLDRAHRHAAVTWRHRLRVTGVSGVAIAFGAGEFVVGLSLPREARTSWAVSGLAVIILGLYALGMARLHPARRSAAGMEWVAQSARGSCGTEGVGSSERRLSLSAYGFI